MTSSCLQPIYSLIQAVTGVQLTPPHVPIVAPLGGLPEIFQAVSSRLTDVMPRELIDLTASYIPHPSTEIRKAIEQAATFCTRNTNIVVRNLKQHYCLPPKLLEELLDFKDVSFSVDLSNLAVSEHILKQLLQNCPHITELHLRSCGLKIDLHVANNGLQEILQFHDLELLDLSGNCIQAGVPSDPEASDPEVYDAIERQQSPFLSFVVLKKLRTLRLHTVFDCDNLELQPDDLAGLHALESLTELDLSNNPHIGKCDQIELFSGFSRLRRLIVQNCPDLHADFANLLGTSRPNIEVVTKVAAPTATSL